MYPQVFGKYVLERELSRGGMARVLLATLRGAGGFEKKLVVKQIRDELSFDQQFIQRFVEEAKTTVALSHPNIVPVYELGLEQGTYFLAMELVEGCSISDLIREQADGKRIMLTPEQGAYVGMEVCRALDYAHRRMSVVHRDITPRNVMLDEEGEVKVIDFGIAAPALVAGHDILGSPGHMPPEQVAGKELGPATDIFAVAVLLMEAWSGVAPFRRATPEACDEAMRQPHPKPSDYDPRLAPLDEVIVRAMKLDPAERQQHAADMARALRAFIQGTDVTDIARELGERVRAIREAAEEPEPTSLDGGPRPPAPSVGELQTKTFAAREEAMRWATPVKEIEPVGASTRKLARSQPPPAEVPTPAPSRTGGQAPHDPAMSIPTPLMMEPVALDPEVVRRAARAAEEAAISSHDVERAAGGARERPRGGDGEQAPSGLAAARERDPARSRAWPFIALAAVVVLGGGIAWRVRSEGARADAVPTSTATLASSTAPSVPSASASPEPIASVAASATSPPASATASGAGAGAAAPRATTHSAIATSATSASPASLSGRAQVAFLGDPGTLVSIDGASRGACPVRVTLEPGQHDVRFSFEPTGESRGERFSVKASERVTIRADFTGASPTVRIHR